MQQSILPLICSLVLTQRLISFSKINNYPQWVKWFNYVRYFSIFLIILSVSDHARWIWHILLVSLLLYVFQQKEMRPLRMFMLAFVPYVSLSALIDLTEVIAPEFYNRWNKYFGTAIMLSVIWLIAIVYSHYKQNKAAEKERINRQKEDEINRAIAIRKVELEGLVAERTSELTQQKEELEHTLEELKATQAQLIQSEKMASLGELTAGIAHEIQNPLNFVNNFSEINSELIGEMKEELVEGSMQYSVGSRQSGEDKLKLAIEIAEDIKQNLEKINHHGKRAEAIVKAMLQHSRTSTGKKELTDINALADEYLRLAYHGLRAKDKSFNATMKTEFDESVGKISVVPQDLGRVILNLITNAFYAVNEKKKVPPPPDISGQTPEEGLKETQSDYEPTVSISTSFIPPSGGQRGAAMISVSDNGNGIPQTAIDKIFQPFFTTKPTGKGTGLGLSMSYEIVTKAHGGELKVDNKPGEGVTFTIVLPV
jgi:signal transduction histidine kinase